MQIEGDFLIIHVVKPGDSIFSISRQYGVPYNKIIIENELTDPSKLVVGQTIVITTPSQKLGTIEVNGYAFPNINMDVLRKTLPNLTYLSIFSYEVKADGSLSTINDEPLIRLARENKVAPIMVITNLSQGGFNSDLAKTILTNEQVQDELLNNVLKVLREKNYYGLDIDFEYIYPENREDYNKFLRKTVDKLRPLGYTIATSLAPKTSSGQIGTLYQGHDYKFHGALVDHVILMTYEWGHTYSEPRAVAPVGEIRKVLNYAVKEIPSQKILMGMPNYGYDWTLPYVPRTAAKTVGNVEAVDIASKENARIGYDWKSQAPNYTYYDDNRKQHAVWFEDARSIQAKLRLVNEYKLGGVSYWTINRYFPQNWLVLNSMYNIKKVL